MFFWEEARAGTWYLEGGGAGGVRKSAIAVQNKATYKVDE